MNAPSPNQELLLAVYEGQRAESLQHRQTIFNSFSLSMAGLLAIAAGIVAPGHLPVELKCIIGSVVLIVLASISIFIVSQRAESEKSMKIMRKIELHLNLFEPNAVITDDTVLPKKYSKPARFTLGLTTADWHHVGSLILVSIGIWILLLFLPP